MSVRSILIIALAASAASCITLQKKPKQPSYPERQAVGNYDGASRRAALAELDASEWRYARLHARYCRDRVRTIVEHDPANGARAMDTIDGPRTFQQMLDRCVEIDRSLAERAVTGCGARVVELAANHLGGDRWTPVQVHVDKHYRIEPCDDQPTQGNPDRFAVARVQVERACGAQPAFYPTDWFYRRHRDTGVLEVRRAQVICWFEGTTNEWHVPETQFPSSHSLPP